MGVRVKPHFSHTFGTACRRDTIVDHTETLPVSSRENQETEVITGTAAQQQAPFAQDVEHTMTAIDHNLMLRVFAQISYYG